MDAVRRGFDRRPAVVIGLALAIAWIGMNVWEWCIHSRYGAELGWYEKLTQVIDSSALGVVGVAALVWLLERSRLFDRS